MTEIDVDIRWMIRRDLQEVLNIERASFDDPWTEEEFRKALRLRPAAVIGVVAERNHEIMGFMIYQLQPDHLKILNFAVALHARRCGVGRQMVQQLVDKLSVQRRRWIEFEVRETNLPAQLFFADSGFKATKVLRKHYDTEDAYFMHLRLETSQ